AGDTGRRYCRPADPRAHRPRDHVDPHPDRPRDGDRDRERDRPFPRRRDREERPPHPGDRAAVHLDVQVPRRTRAHERDARAAERPRGGARLPVEGRHPCVLRARVPREHGRRSRLDDHHQRHADAGRHVPGDLQRALRARSRHHALDRAGDDADGLRQGDPEATARRARHVSDQLEQMTAATLDPHGHQLIPARSRGPIRRMLLGPGFIRAAWMFCLFGAIGFGLVIGFRWWGGWHPLFDMQPITLVSLLVAGPLGFLAGIGAFDYWTRYAIGSPTQPEDHSGHGARTWHDYFRVNTDHKVIGVQYLVTTIFFFIAGGFLAMLVRVQLARPDAHFFDPQTY